MTSLENFAAEESKQETILRLQRQLAKAHDYKEEMVDAAIAAARDAQFALGPIPVVVAPTLTSRDKPVEVALWHMTDWQGAKRTTSYNSEIMKERVMRFAHKAATITTTQRADHEVNDCLIAFGGDMIEGLFNFPTQPFEIDSTLFTQYTTVSRLMVDLVRFALGLYDKVTVVAEWGNHGRIGSQRSVVPRSDNFDRMCYELARTILEDHPRLTWEDSAEDVQQIEIGAYKALLIHGDEVGRNGFASPMSIVRHFDRWRSGAWPWEFRDGYVGHYHTHNEWAMANGLGTVYQTGSIESDNRYARETMASSAVPSQRLHFIDPERGRVTSQWKIYVDE